MKLNIINSKTAFLHEAIGMTEERRLELSKMMDGVGSVYRDIRPVPVHSILDYIASFCNTVEELVFCTFTHGIWLAKTNRITTSREEVRIMLSKGN